MSIDSTVTRRMTMAKEVTPEKKFVTTILPWVIAAGAFVLYLATRDSWQTVAGARIVGAVSGWSHQMDLTRPLYWLATLPIRLLPDTWVPLALNLFSIVCGALTLALLARCVALLPHDRTEDQRLREQSPLAVLTIGAAWLPPLLAALGCGLQLTFWEQATGISTEIFDLLVFAYAVRCLLEYRFEGADSWLVRAVLVYAAGMTNNWAMVAMAPLFLAALIWMKGLSFFEGRFLTRILFVGSLGLCFYLLLPLVSGVSSTSPDSFWGALKSGLNHQRSSIGYFVSNYGVFFRGERPLWVLALPSFLPLLALSIRWPATFGDHSKLGQSLASLTVNVLHGILFVICAWTLLDARFSPRNYAPGLVYLPLYFLTALSLGYYSGYFLLCFGGAKPVRRLPRVEPAYTPLLNTAVTGAVWLVFLLVPLMQVYANWGHLLQTGPLLRTYAELKARSLPKGAVVLADANFPWQVDGTLVEAALIGAGTRREVVLVQTCFLTNAYYHRFLAKHHPGVWKLSRDPRNPGQAGNELPPFLGELSRSRELYYLHPSFGEYFENFYLEPFGAVFQLVPCGTNAVLQPPLPPGIVATNQAFWAAIESSQLQALTAALADTNRLPHGPSVLAGLAERLKLKRAGFSELNSAAASYSRALTFWGVQLQRNRLLPEAAACFQRALDLRPDNFCADLNLACNRNLQAGKDPRVELTTALEEKMRTRGNMLNALNWDGPIDEPTGCIETAAVFEMSANYRQAAEEYKRLTEFRPKDLWSRLQLADSLNLRNAPGEALKVISEIQRHEQDFGIDSNTYPAVLRMELTAHLLNQDQEKGDQLVRAALTRYGGNDQVLGVASDVYLRTGYSSNATSMLERQLSADPDNWSALINLGVAWLRLSNYAKALPPLDRAVQIGTNASPSDFYLALFNRAAAYVGNNQLDEGQRDYEQLYQGLSASTLDTPEANARAANARAMVDLKLGDVGFRKKDTELAVRHYESFLREIAAQNRATNTPAVLEIFGRLDEMKKSKP